MVTGCAKSSLAQDLQTRFRNITSVHNAVQSCLHTVGGARRTLAGFVIGRRGRGADDGAERTSRSRKIETLVRDHPAISDITVVGVPDPIYGERVCAVVVLAPETNPDTESPTVWLRTRGSARNTYPNTPSRSTIRRSARAEKPTAEPRGQQRRAC
ncbi:hypothetical protein [Nocardia sp. BMG51109]|uniref:AMP-binding enzyme n=1 Tax=Nocardia sp. BMG51109 TaxID=1056816 RepID=UPI000A04A53D